MKRLSHCVFGLGLLFFFFGCSDSPTVSEECGEDSQNFAECDTERVKQQEVRVNENKARTLELLDNSVSYLYELSLIRGHLWVGHQLAKKGYHEHAIMHAKHPEDEIYSALIEVFSGRGVEGFALELRQFFEAVESNNKEQIDSRYQELVDSVHQSQTNITISTEELFRLINRLVRQAAAEYAVGIIDGRVDNVHEYQDALGFTEIALRWTRAHLRNNSLAESELLSTNLLKQKLEKILVMWPDLVPSAEVPFDSSMLFGLSADIEIMILSL